MFDPRNAAKNLAKMGRYGDTELVHAEPKERIIPNDFQEKMPRTMSALDIAMKAAGVPPERYTVAHTSGPKNPKSGAEEFFSEGDGPNGMGQDGGESGSGPGGMGGGGASPGGAAPATGEYGQDNPVSGTPSNNPSMSSPNASPAGPGQQSDVDSLIERAVKTMTRVNQLEKAQEIGALVESELEDMGIPVDTGTEPGFGGTAPGTNNDPNDDPGGSTETTDEDRAGTQDPTDALPEDPDAEAEKTYSLSVSRSPATMPDIGALIEAYGQRSTPATNMLTSIRSPAPRVNPTTGAQMFARQDNFDADYYLAQNPDVAAAGVDAWDHYNTMGKTEGRLGNENEKKARDEGFTDEFKDGNYVNWKQNQVGAVTGGLSADKPLTGGNYQTIEDFYAPGGLTALQERARGRQQGFEGDYGGGRYKSYTSTYRDDDGDPSTAWTAPNSANIDRSGQDVSYVRELLRRAGFDQDWGSGGAQGHLSSGLSKYGIDPTGDMADDARALYTAQRQPAVREMPWWLRGSSAGPSLFAGVSPTQADREAANATRNSSVNAIELLSGLTPDRRRRYVNSENRRMAPGFAA